MSDSTLQHKEAHDPTLLKYLGEEVGPCKPSPDGTPLVAGIGLQRFFEQQPESRLPSTGADKDGNR